MSQDGPLLVVSVGTDHHRFDRLAAWIERWLVGRTARVVYQEGASRAPAGAEAIGLVARDELLALIDQADVVISQAGPGSIVDANERGRVPIVVPRRAHLDEVVDDHQVAFAERMAALDRAYVATSEAQLHELIDRAVADPARTRTTPHVSLAAEASEAFGRVAGELAGGAGDGGPPRVLLIASTGGHLAQLAALRPWWERQRRRWVTFDKHDARALLADEQVTWAYHPTTRNLWNALRNAVLAVRDLRRARPDLVVSTGAGVAVPYFLVARLLGIRTVYIEVIDRIELPSLSGRICYRLSDAFCLQWEAQRGDYPDGHLIGPLL